MKEVRPARAVALAVALAVGVSTVLAATLVRLWAQRALDYGDTVFLAGNLFRLSRGENAGVAFGLLAGSPLVPWLAVPALGAFALLLARPLLGSRSGGTALGLILGGSLANLLDRLGDGRVTDYLDLGLGGWRWPAFNLPDTAIVAGALLTLWMLARSSPGEKYASPSAAEDRSRVGEYRTRTGLGGEKPP